VYVEDAENDADASKSLWDKEAGTEFKKPWEDKD
jgi:hypothetical protein